MKCFLAHLLGKTYDMLWRPLVKYIVFYTKNSGEYVEQVVNAMNIDSYVQNLALKGYTSIGYEEAYDVDYYDEVSELDEWHDFDPDC